MIGVGVLPEAVDSVPVETVFTTPRHPLKRGPVVSPARRQPYSTGWLARLLHDVDDDTVKDHNISPIPSIRVGLKSSLS